jgi:exosortase family protein XrtF
MLKDLLKNKISVFFLKAGVIYLVWFIVYEFIIKPYTKVDEKLIYHLISVCSFVLKLFNYDVFISTKQTEMQMIGIDGSHPVWIGDPCDGLTVMALFSIFIIAFPGNYKNKLWFIPTGILLIHVLNIIRVICLTYIAYAHSEYLSFNHTYTFTIIVYVTVFAFWMIWVNKYSKIK